MDATNRAIDNARTHLQEQRFDEARRALRPLLERDPGHGAANSLMAQAVLAAEGPAAAEPFAERAHRAEPSDYQRHALLLQLLVRQGKFERAANELPHLVRANPGDARLPVMLTGTLLSLERPEEVVEWADFGLSRHPHNRVLALNRALALLRLGQAETATTELRRLADAAPPDPKAVLSLPVVLNYTTVATDREMLERHRNAGLLFGKAAAPSRPAKPDPARRLRVGLLSADLRYHSVASFAEAILRSLEPAEFELVVLNAAPKRDAVQERLRALGHVWHDLHSLRSTAEADAFLRSLGLDVIVELGGLVSGTLLAGLVGRPAPLQLTYLGYPNTTGCGFIDLRVVDSYTDPPGSEAQSTERLVRLDPCFLCYSPPAGAPPVSVRSGPFVFGCFGSSQKFSKETFDLWGATLVANPHALLHLKSHGLQGEPARRRVLEALALRGVTSERVTFLPYASDLESHLRGYGGVDVALDTYPYHGTTTTCEALLMGVPTVTLVGTRHASRVGISLLSQVGLERLAAGTSEAFVAAASSLVRGKEELAALRADLRARTIASPLCDGASFAARFGAALRTAWIDACAR